MSSASAIVGDPAGSPSYRSVARGRLHLDVARQVADCIIGGQLAPGQALPSEQELGLRFGVSRTVIRAALGLLETQGLVDIAHGKRSVVCAEEEWNLLDPAVLEAHARLGRLTPLVDDIFHTRLALEVAAAEQAAERATEEMLAVLAELCATMERHLQERDAHEEYPYSYADYRRWDTTFHGLLANASGNRVLRRVLHNLSQVFNKITEFNPLQHTEYEVAARAHRAIYDRIVARDAAGAVETMRAHILWAWRRWDKFKSD